MSAALEPPYVIALDIGTSSMRVGMYDRLGRRVPEVEAGLTHAPSTTPNGGAEMDAEALVDAACRTLEGALAQAGTRAEEIAGVGVCTFWHSILGVDEAGRSTTPVIMWADTRSVGEVETLRGRLDERAAHARTGCPFHTSYVPPKLLWLHRERPAEFARTRRWLSPGEYLFLRLFGEARCSVSMASGTGMLDQRRLDWDEELLSVLPIERGQLSFVSDLSPSGGLRDEFARRLPALAHVPWLPAVGDGACSNLGSGCLGPDRAAVMVGTSGAMRVVRRQVTGAGRREASGVRREPDVVRTSERVPGEPLLTPHASRLTPEAVAPPGLWCYRIDAERPLIGGALSNGGNLFAWLNETLRLPEPKAAEAELAAMTPDAHGLTVLPFLAGERSPGWAGHARAAFAGLSWSTRPIDMLCAGLESVAYRFALIAERLPLQADTQVVATGGALLSSPTWTQIVCDVLGRPLVASEEPEASGHGAALLALETLGVLSDLSQAPFAFGRVFEPDMRRHEVYQAARRRQAVLYERLVEQTLDD
jgi:gluconokinase